MDDKVAKKVSFNLNNKEISIIIEVIQHSLLKEFLKKIYKEIIEEATIINGFLKQDPDSENFKKTIFNHIEKIEGKILECETFLNTNTIENISKQDARIILSEITEACNYIQNELSSSRQIIQTPKFSMSEALNQYSERKIDECLLNTLLRVKNFFEENKYTKRSCFISYAWPSMKGTAVDVNDDESWVQDFLKMLRTHLRNAGITAYLDILDNDYGANINDFMRKANRGHFIILIGTKSLLEKHQKGISAVCTELIEIKRKRQTDKENNLAPRVFPMLLNGTERTSFPANYELYSTIRDWRKKPYIVNLIGIIRAIYGESNENSDYKALWTEFNSFFEQNQKAINYQPNAALATNQTIIPAKPDAQSVKIEGEPEKSSEEIVTTINETTKNLNLNIENQNFNITLAKTNLSYYYCQAALTLVEEEIVTKKQWRDMLSNLQQAIQIDNEYANFIRNMAVQNAHLKNVKTLLHRSVYEDQLELVKLLLNLRVKIDTKDIKGNTPLHLAVKKGLVDMVVLLLAANAKTDITNIHKLTPLDIAVANGDVFIVQIFLRRIDISIKNILFKAIQLEKIDIVKMILDYHQININFIFEKFKKVIEKKENKETTKNVLIYKMTYICEAAIRGNIEILNLLLKNKEIDVNIPCFETEENALETAFCMAAKLGHQEIVKRLLLFNKTDLDAHSLSLAIKFNQETMVQILLDSRKININEEGPSYDPPLCRACISGNVKIIKLLLTQPDLNINIYDKYGMFPLYWAVEKQHGEAIKTLLSIRKLKVNQKKINIFKINEKTKEKEVTEYGLSAFQLACSKNFLDIIEILLAHPEIDPNQLNDGWSPFHRAIQEDKTDIVKILIKSDKVDINQINDKVGTALHIA